MLNCLRRHTLGCLFVAVMVTLFASERISAQYCGGTLQYVVKDQGGNLIDALDVRVVKSSPEIFTLIRTPTSGKLSSDQKERFKRNGHIRSILAGRPMQVRDENDKASSKPGNVEGLEVSTFAIRMGCGLPLAELVLEYHGDQMHLRFVNIIELDAVADSLPFQPKTFEMDLNSVYRGSPSDRSKLNNIGLSSGKDLLLTWHAKAGALIASSNWKEITTPH